MPEGSEQIKKDVALMTFATMTLMDLINEENMEPLVNIMADTMMRTGTSRLASFIQNISPNMVYEAVERMNSAILTEDELPGLIAALVEEGNAELEPFREGMEL